MPTFIFLLLGNVWIWKIFQFNFFTGIFILISTILLFVYLKHGNRKLILVFTLLLLLTIGVSGGFRKIDLSYGSQEKLLMQQRLKEYPSITFLPVAHWFEERPEIIAVYRVSQNLSEVLDPNLYFFANHPRERGGIEEIEKFPYVLFPFFFIGLFLLIYKKFYKLIIVSAVIPIIYYVIYGTGNSVEPFLLFPFLVISVYFGVGELISKISWKVVFWIFYTIVLIQSIVYAIY